MQIVNVLLFKWNVYRFHLLSSAVVIDFLIMIRLMLPLTSFSHYALRRDLMVASVCQSVSCFFASNTI